MLENQDGVNWPRWQRIAKAVEGAGFAGLYCSDHFTNPEGEHLDSLELWTSLTWLATQTQGLAFGPVVSPVSFRDPVMAAWSAASIDALAPGRLRLGLGAGWQEREHRELGYDLLDLDGRFQRFTEALQITELLLHREGPVSFSGEFYSLDGAEFMPNPIKNGRIPIVVGGNGVRRTLPLAARYADEWNGVYLTIDGFKERNQLLDDLAREAGREPGAIRRTLMTRVIFGQNEDQLAERLAGESADDLRASGRIVGTAAEIPAQLRALEDAGVAGVMLQWIDDLDDVAGIAALGEAAARR